MSEVREIECSICGLNREPPASCEICHGGAPVQQRGYTLSDHRAGRVPEHARDPHRFGGFESLNPKSSPLVVGGAVDHPSHPQN